MPETFCRGSETWEGEGVRFKNLPQGIKNTKRVKGGENDERREFSSENSDPMRGWW